MDTIIDDQRALRGAEFVETRAKLIRALGGDSRCCRVIVFAVHNYLERLGPRTKPDLYNYPIEDLNPQLYRRITQEMPIGLSTSKADLCALREAARELVAAMSTELFKGGQLLDTGIACDASQIRNPDDEYPCGKEP